MITAADYQYEKVSGQYVPGRYPGEKLEKWVLPEDIRSEYARLNSIIETKYSREYLKICAFYNKLFPALRSSGYVTSSYNVPAFTAMDQERIDTGTGIASNYLKQIVDQVVSRLGTVTFEPALLSDVPTLEYVIFREEVERQLRKTVRDDEINRIVMECFHDAAVVNFAHVFIDPVTHKPSKANDYEIGMFEPQFIAGDLKQVLYRNYSFPTTSLPPYLAHCSKELIEEITDSVGAREWVDLKMYFDCPGRRVVITIDGKTLPDVEYPFETVQMVTFGWDVGFSRVTAASLFDLLYPTQRELNRVNAKIQQLIRMYKGAVPVFNSDVDLAMKAITNGSGEALYVDSSRPIDTLMTVINPTPLDGELLAQKQELKSEMYELAGLQQMSFNMENMRSAAAVIAVDQTRDTVFQAQLSGIASFVSRLFKMQVHYAAVVSKNEDMIAIDSLLKEAVVELKPVSATNPLGTKSTAEQVEPDYASMAASRAVIQVIRGRLTYDNVPFSLDRRRVLLLCAQMIVRFEAVGIDVPDSLQSFMVAGFLDDITNGMVVL